MNGEVIYQELVDSFHGSGESLPKRVYLPREELDTLLEWVSTCLSPADFERYVYPPVIDTLYGVEIRPNPGE